jgi:hypothetical protein
LKRAGLRRDKRARATFKNFARDSRFLVNKWEIFDRASATAGVMRIIPDQTAGRLNCKFKLPLSERP